MDRVFVLGNPQYYRRFGFDPKGAERFSSPYSSPAFMALAIKEAVFGGLYGRAEYPSAFKGLYQNGATKNLAKFGHKKTGVR